MRKNKAVQSESNTRFFDNRILRVEQVAEILQFSKWHVYRLANQKKIPSYKRGKTLFFKSAEIMEWIEEGAS